MEQVFRKTEKSIKEQTENTGLSTINWGQPIWRESSLLFDRAVRVMKSNTYVFSDSVQCLGRISPELVQAWKDKLNGMRKHAIPKNWIEFAENRFEWTNFPGSTTVGIINEIQKMMAELKCELEQFQGRIIFMYKYIIWRRPGNHENCMANSMNGAACAKKFPHGCWSFLGPGCEKKLYGTHVSKPYGEWNKTADS